MRPYQETISWLRFKLDLRQAPPSFWLLLGECVAGIRHLTAIPLTPTESRALEREVLGMGLQARLAQDGISLGADQIQLHLQGRLQLPSSQESAQLELDDLLHTWQRLLQAPSPEGRTLDPSWILEIHRALGNPEKGIERAGAWRISPYGISPLEGVPPEVISLFIEELCDWLNGPELAAPTEEEVPAFALLRALVAELYWAWIRPFGFGNGKLIGTLSLEILRQGGVGSTAGHLAARFFMHSARAFRFQTDQAAAGMADPIPFLAFALRGISDGLREIHERARDLQITAQWRAQLLDLFSDANDAPTRRQRQVLLDLGEHGIALPQSDLPALSTALAKLYAGVSEKTLRRDVDALVAAGIVRRSPEGIQVERGQLLAFKR